MIIYQCTPLCMHFIQLDSSAAPNNNPHTHKALQHTEKRHSAAISLRTLRIDGQQCNEISERMQQQWRCQWLGVQCFFFWCSVAFWLSLRALMWYERYFSFSLHHNAAHCLQFSLHHSIDASQIRSESLAYLDVDTVYCISFSVHVIVYAASNANVPNRMCAIHFGISNSVSVCVCVLRARAIYIFLLIAGWLAEWWLKIYFILI